MKRFLKVISLIAACSLVIGFMQSYVMRPWDFNHLRTKGFYLEPQDSIDIVLLGQSDIVRSWSPLHNYENTGYTSYPLSCDGITAAMWLPMAKEAIRHQHPDLLVVDVNNVTYNEDMELHRPFDQQLVDDMPYDDIRLSLALEARRTGSPRWLNYLFPLREYHSGFPQGWRNVPEQIREIRDIEKRGYTYFKGDAQTCVSAGARDILDLNTAKETMELSAPYEKVLNDFLDYCDANQLNVLFLQTPHRIPNKESKLYASFKRASRAGEIIEERGYPFINTELLKEEIGLDMQKDFYNNGHLNLYGQHKYTDWLFNEIQTRGLLHCAPDHTAAVRAEWDECLKYYHAYTKYLPEYRPAKDTDMCMETPQLIEMLEKDYMN